MTQSLDDIDAMPADTAAPDAESSSVRLPAAPDVSAAVRDPQRLEMLRATGLLDAPAEPAFDRLTRLAARLLEVPIAFFSLVDETRDFYISACGVGDALGGARGLTGTTFCHHAIQGRDPLVIPDTRADPVYRNIESVTTLGVAACIGVPVIVGGHAIGSLCVIDMVPRAWTDAQIDTLTELSASAEREISLRSAVATAQRLAEQLQQQFSVLEIERHRLADVFAQAPSFLAVLRGPDNVFEMVNAAYERIIGRGREVIGKPLLEAIPEARGQGFAQYLAQVRTMGEPLVLRDLPVMLERERGAALEERFIDITYLPLVEADGTRESVIAHGMDVTEHVRARRDVERLLAESADAARLLARSDAAARRALDELEATYGTAPVGLAVVDVNLRFQRVNARLAEINGPSVEAHIGRTVREIVPGLADVVEPRLQRVLDSGVAEYNVAVSGETPAAPGVVRHWVEHWLPLRDGPGAIVGINVVAEEITERRQAEVERERLLHDAEAARADADLERRRLRAVLEHLPVGVHVAEAPSGRLLLDNAAVRAICGQAPTSERVAEYSADYAGHYPAGHPQAGERLPSEAWPLARTLSTGAPTGDELVEIRRADGTCRLASVSAAPVRDAEGQLVGAVATSVDVTERERLLIDADVARRAAEAANQSKADFLAIMSHELRTPLNAIAGYTELLELGIRGPVTPAQRADLGRIHKSQRHLLGLINGVLNFAKLDAGSIDFVSEDVAMHELLGACELLILPQLHAKGLTLETHCDRDIPLVRADREKTQQVLLNLLSNALKFTEAGGRVAMRCEADHARHVLVHVIDTGRGIAADQLERIFHPFVQVDVTLTRAGDGTGLGLAISRDLARGMGGELTVTSIVGAGSTFTLSLPRTAPR